MAEEQVHLNAAQRALEWVEKILVKRRARIRYCHRRKVHFNKAARKAEREKRWRNAKTAARKAAYWNELEDKAILGRAEFAKRKKRIEHKINILNKKLKARSQTPSTGASTPDAPWNPYKRPIANWLIPWLNKTWEAGCHFTVTSGYRSPDYQCEVCKQVCGNCGGCPGTCAAPGTSNHGRTEYPGGAVDVTNYYAFAATQARIGSPLHNTLGSRDPVHFSVAGN